MKPFYVIFLMGAAAITGGLLVRYSDHPVEVTFARPMPPNVVAPPIPPTAHVGPSTSVPVRSAPPVVPVVPEPAPNAPQKREKPSAMARVRIPPDPPAVVFLERSSVAPTPPPAPAPAPKPAPVPTPPESNHATLKAGILITVRINEALSSNLNSAGDVFSGVLEKPLIADGFAIAERGAHVRGEVVESKGAQDGGPQELAIRLREVLASDGQRVHLVSQPWRKAGVRTQGSGNVYDAALTRNSAAVIRAYTSITFRLDQSVELTEKH